MPTLSDAHALLQLLDLTKQSIHQIIAEWAKVSKPGDARENGDELVSRELFEAQRTLIAATGKLVELVSSPSDRLLEVSSQYNESRCLHIAATLRIPDLLAKSQPQEGVTIEELATIVGVEKKKLGRIMRCLCSIHIFQEIRDGVFANNTISASLVDNDPLRAYIVMFASEALPQSLLDPDLGPLYSVNETAWQRAIGTTKARWTWLEEEVEQPPPPPTGSSGYSGPFGPDLAHPTTFPPRRRSELEIFGLAMLGGGRVFGRAHLFDYPWGALGPDSATVVDVGGGVGGFCLQLSHLYSHLRFVIQDRSPVLSQAEHEVWPQENPDALARGSVQFIVHDFFDPNPVIGADVYWLRYILHDWSDDYCVRILTNIKSAMRSHSRLLICEQVMYTTAETEREGTAPSPLPANYGYWTRYSHQRDITMMSIINGIERTPAEFAGLIERAGLRLRKIWDCRSQVSLVECILP
ncbi:S-adenosyl-L-methionine-dependent methyltransferase [Aspergillus sclerotioniger CBS 115572]|uniref:S-adenosyl-L-methionine-dependent methyltransferase n=1 Tax=Aspergillus sclerotioniger CBS 115572 TaxID=1450535 RepID=A0A317X3S9_9EURO|nr:S-adenosyl-L-methionine-dependent methyltransferase [Aspergillus sclerotioniger CBS 115572]PWY93216.1 S-adenosyl-L-methionine-dependent methyltransferase [Aspergillus sclerotioniger CBS 115572]